MCVCVCIYVYYYADTYDCIIATGLFAPGHAKADCIPEMIRLVKPGECLLPGGHLWYYYVAPCHSAKSLLLLGGRGTRRFRHLWVLDVNPVFHTSKQWSAECYPKKEKGLVQFFLKTQAELQDSNVGWDNVGRTSGRQYYCLANLDLLSGLGPCYMLGTNLVIIADIDLLLLLLQCLEWAKWPTVLFNCGARLSGHLSGLCLFAPITPRDDVIKCKHFPRY